MVHASVAAHRIEPALHRALEKEFPFFDAPKNQSPADHSIHRLVRQLLEEHRAGIAPRDRDPATWIVLHTLESLVHAAVTDAPAAFSGAAVEQAIVEVLMGYLGGTGRQPQPGR